MSLFCYAAAENEQFTAWRGILSFSWTTSLVHWCVIQKPHMNIEHKSVCLPLCSAAKLSTQRPETCQSSLSGLRFPAQHAASRTLAHQGKTLTAWLSARTFLWISGLDLCYLNSSLTGCLWALLPHHNSQDKEFQDEEFSYLHFLGTYQVDLVVSKFKNLPNGDWAATTRRALQETAMIWQTHCDTNITGM